VPINQPTTTTTIFLHSLSSSIDTLQRATFSSAGPATYRILIQYKFRNELPTTTEDGRHPSGAEVGLYRKIKDSHPCNAVADQNANSELTESE